MKVMIPVLIASLVAALPVASVAQAQSGQAGGAPGAALPKTTEVMVIVTVKQGAPRQQVMAVMPSEVRETVKLYLDGKIRRWYSRAMVKAPSSSSTRRPKTRRERSRKLCRSQKLSCWMTNKFWSDP